MAPVVASLPNGRIRAHSIVHRRKVSFCSIPPLESETVAAASEAKAHKLGGEGFALVVDLAYMSIHGSTHTNTKEQTRA